MSTLKLYKIRITINYLSIALRILSIALAGMLLYTATKKVMDLEAFAAHIEVLPYMHAWITYVLSVVVILMEYGLGVMLLYQPMRKAVYVGVLSLMLIYTAYIYAVLHHALMLLCSCQGAFKSMTWEQHYLVNAVMVAVTLTTLLLVYLFNKHTNKQF